MREKTVETELGRAYSKLGMHWRSALAAPPSMATHQTRRRWAPTPRGCAPYLSVALQNTRAPGASLGPGTMSWGASTSTKLPVMASMS